jgi:glucose-6-phosphate dehydrogenase assembly protein OpcA
MSSAAPIGRGGTTIPLRTLTSDAIENQLMVMWRQVASTDLASGNPVLAHNSVMTLVAYTPGKQQSRRVCEVVGDVLGRVAARAIVLVPVPAQPGAPPVEVSLRIHERDANNQPAHGEEILIQAHDDAVWHLPGAVLPLVLSGLPAFLWWTGEPPWQTELFDALVDGCDRLIVDASEVEHAERTLVRLHELVGRKKTSCAVTDLNWRRQTPWRELVAQFFDAPAVRPYLFGLDRVSIEYAADTDGAATNPAQAYLLAGWLASRLGWMPRGGIPVDAREPAREYTLVTAQNRSVRIELTPRYGVPIRPWIDLVPQMQPVQAQSRPGGDGAGAGGSNGRDNGAANGNGARAGSGAASAASIQLAALGPGALMSVHLHATLTGKTATFAVAREADLTTASMLCHADSALCAVPSQSSHLPTLGETQYLMDQLQMLGHDTVYEEALAAAARLIAPAMRRNGR